MKQKVHIILLIIITAFFYKSNAQDNSPSHIIGVMSFTTPSESFSNQTSELQEIVTEILSKKKYITLLDRSKVEQIEAELKKQKQGNYVDGVTVEQNKSFGAKEILNGTVNNIDAVSTTTNTPAGVNLLTKQSVPASSVTTFKSKISFALQLVSVETGQVISGKSFDVGTTSGSSFSFDGSSSYNSRDAALSNAVKNSKKQITQLVNDWINDIYPPPLSIVTIDTRKKNGFPETVSLIGGIEANLMSGNDLIVYEVQELDVQGMKKKKKMEIGTMKVKEHQGDFTLCKVTGGEEILESKWKEGTIQIIVKPKK